MCDFLFAYFLTRLRSRFKLCSRTRNRGRVPSRDGIAWMRVFLPRIRPDCNVVTLHRQSELSRKSKAGVVKLTTNQQERLTDAVKQHLYDVPFRTSCS